MIRTWKLVLRDLKSGPRSPVFLFSILMPLLVTFLLKVVFVSLLAPKARLAVADLGGSQIVKIAENIPEINLIHAENAADLRNLVEAHDADAGIVLTENFDDAVRAGEKPRLEFFLSGESLLSNRVLLAVSTLDLVRGVEARSDPVAVRIYDSAAGEKAPPISVRIVPSVLIFVMLVTGVFVPAFMLVSERERKTLHALLVTPVTMSEILMSKAILGIFMVMTMSCLTLALNRALGGEILGLLLFLMVGAVMCIEVGLIYGTTVKDAQSLYTLIKSLNVLLAGPVIFYLFPSWPQWIARLFPTFWFIDPIYRMSLQGASFNDVKSDLLVAWIICIVLLPVVWSLGKRLQVKLAST